MMNVPSCPKCHSVDVLFSPKRQQYICEDCDLHWKLKESQDEDDEVAQNGKTKKKVFISYGRKDATVVAERLTADLEERGYAVLLDVKFMKSGESWEAQIEKHILDCDVFLSLLSPHAVRRPMGVCLDEISLARYSDRKIIPCMVVKCRPPLSIYRLDWVDLQQWERKEFYDRGLERIVSVIEEELENRGSVVSESGSSIFRSIKPLDFGREIARLTKDFTGRKWLLDDIDDWYLQNNTNSRVFLLTGGPGTGKSALAAQLTNKHPKVLAYHFCMPSEVDSLDPSLFVRSIAAQLSTQLPDYREALCALDLSHVYEWDASTQFRRLIVDPLRGESCKEPILFVIDALDKSLERGIDNICQILCQRLVDLPTWVKIVATTRPHGLILDMLSEFGPRELDVSRTESSSDIETYLSQSLSELPMESEVDKDQICKALLQRSEGNFLSAVNEIETLRTNMLKKSTIFISYDRGDSSNLAKRLSEDLEGRGHTVMLDLKFATSGESIEAQIEEHILGCDVFISLLSPHAVRRPTGACLDEISFARYSDRMIVPCMVMRCRPPLSIYRLDMIDLQQWEQKAFYDRAIKRIASIIEGPENKGDVEGSHSAIFGSFKPLDFGREIVRLTKDFTGRKWILDDVDDWYNNPAGSRVFLLTGRPGTGKSAVAAQLINRHPKVLAYHFCISTLADSLDPSLFVRSIAAQLSTQLPDYCDALSALDLSQVKEWDSSTQFRRLIVDPLKAESGSEPMLWVVDALDESLERDVDNICRILSQRLVDLPSWVKVVVTTRSNPQILDMLSAFRPRELDVFRKENHWDIETYLNNRLTELLMMERKVDKERVSQVLLERSEGNFLYAVQAIGALQTGLMDPTQPENFPIGLIGIYRSFFTRLFPSPGDFKEIRPLLDVIVAARSYLDAKRIAAVTKQDPFTVEQQMVQVSPFFPLKDGRYVACHKSIVDWLKGDVGHDLTYRVNVDGGHQRLARYLKELYLSNEWDEFLLNHYVQHLLHNQQWADLKQVTCNMRFLKLTTEDIGWNHVQHDFLRILDAIPQRQVANWLADIRKAIMDQIEDQQEQFVWSRVIAYWLNRSQHVDESILFDIQGGKITDMLFESKRQDGETLEALCFAENSCMVYGRSGLFQQAVDVAQMGEEFAMAGLPGGPLSDLIRIQFLEIQARSIRNLNGDQAALPLYTELQKQVSTVAWDLTIDDLQKLEYDVSPLPRTPSSSKRPEEGQVKVQLVCNAYDAFNALYVIRWLEMKGARVDWRHHSDCPPPEIAPNGYDLSIILGGPLSPSMFNYNVEFRHLPGFMDLYRVDKTDAFGVFKLRRNGILCCLAAGSTKFLTTAGSIAITEDSEIHNQLLLPSS